MIKIGKYNFIDKETADAKIKSLGVEIDDEGNEYATHSHCVVRLGNIILEQSQYDDEGNKIKDAVLSEKYHLDVAWKDLESHPYGWKSYAVAVADGNGVHSFYGVDYQDNKM